MIMKKCKKMLKVNMMMIFIAIGLIMNFQSKKHEEILKV